MGEEIFVNKTKLSKIIKHGKKILIDNPFIFFNKNKISIKIHFDICKVETERMLTFSTRSKRHSAVLKELESYIESKVS